MQKVRLLTIEELRKYQTQKTTDFAYLTGAHQNQKSSEEDFVDSPRFSSTTNGYGWVSSVYGDGEDWAFQSEKDMSCPVLLEKGSIRSDNQMVILTKKGRLLDENDMDSSFLFGAYPQTVADVQKAMTLEQRFFARTLTKTKNAYTYFVDDAQAGYPSQRPQRCFEYEIDGKRYVRVIPEKIHFLRQGLILSDGQKLESEKPYWVEVEPLKWMVFGKKISPNNQLLDKEAYLSVIPVAGMTWDKTAEFFEKTFTKEMMQSNDFCLRERGRSIISSKVSHPKRISTVKLRD